MDIIFNSYKAKYETLNDLTSPIFSGQTISSINLFISLDDIISKFKNSNANRQVQCCGSIATKQMASNIINLVAHYREWAIRKKAHVRTYVYYTSSTIFDNRIFDSAYRKRYVMRNDLNNPDAFFVNRCVREMIPLLTTIFQYISDCYFINTKTVEPADFPYLCATEFPDHHADWNFVITRDKVEFQYSILDKFSVIFPRGEDTRLITSANLWKFVMDREKIEGSKCELYPPHLYVVALAVIGDPKRDIPKICRSGWKTVCNIIDEIIEEYPDLSEVTLTNKFLEVISQRKYNIDKMANNSAMLSISYNVKLIENVTKELIKSQFIDTPDTANLIDLNRQPNMFERCPMNIKFLTDQYTAKEDPFKLGKYINGIR